jgi:hypothetical protein
MCLLDKEQTLGVNNFITLNDSSIITSCGWNSAIVVTQSKLIYKAQFVPLEAVEKWLQNSLIYGLVTSY